jgi:hypothetical protein
VDDRRNAGRGEVVPPRFEGVLARVLAEKVRSLNARFDNQYTRRWLAYTEERLCDPDRPGANSEAITIFLP